MRQGPDKELFEVFCLFVCKLHSKLTLVTKKGMNKKEVSAGSNTVYRMDPPIVAKMHSICFGALYKLLVL